VTDDSVNKLFGDLDYPGRRKPVNREKKEPAPSDTPIWDARPTPGVVNGRTIEFFPISALAKALGYSQNSIRLWETQGLLPRSPFRSQPTRAKPGAKHPTKGRRLWTREQIECILQLAEKHKVILNRQPPTRSFALDVGKAFAALQADQ
jgi:hypothetical protein